jgi:hypothetical protein
MENTAVEATAGARTAHPVQDSITMAHSRLGEIEAAVEQQDYREAFAAWRTLERAIKTIREDLREHFRSTFDYEAHVRQRVAEESRYGRGCSLAYGLHVWSDDRYDQAVALETVNRLVAAGEFVIKNHNLYTPEGWQETLAKRRSQSSR